jgi:hypothetical protein
METKTKPDGTPKRTADNFNRDFNRIKFDGKDYPKGRLVLAVIKKYVAEKNPTAAQLRAAFPDTLLPNYGIVRDVAVAKKATVHGKKRYFLKSDQTIRCKDGRVIAVANQFSSENIKPFIEHVKTLGYSVASND